MNRRGYTRYTPDTSLRQGLGGTLDVDFEEEDIGNGNS